MHVKCATAAEARAMAERHQRSDGPLFLEFPCQTKDCTNVILRNALQMAHARTSFCSVCGAKAERQI